ncbi:type II toxin-antitoxin system PemK/MazF family toxin [Chakrabartyella piscis]|uniref:type II toxin-antitoxin system PemK/MazF family toxin n=1 Tax=Chakrabartyella piscis TaxID=2918914 RepID=UPI0029589234|nr:type II toxin-antitoxin system PemK/MazF family toxin [Chakrabartyella piscis]
MKKKKVHRGDIYYCDLDPVKGSVQGGVRPVVIIQNQTGNNNSPTLIVAVITTIIKKVNQPTHLLIGERFGLPKNSMIMFEQIRTIDKCELLDFVGTISEPTVIGLCNQAIKVSLGVDGRCRK